MRPRSRWVVPQAWAAGLVIYGIAIGVASTRGAIWINALAWTLSALAAALVCGRTARRVEEASRKGWMLITIGCASWLIGQLHWDFYQLVLGVPLEFPNVGQVFYWAFAICLIAGILYMPEVRRGAPLTLKHLGNVGLVVCCLLVTGVLGLVEPALESERSVGIVAIGGIHSVLLASTFLVSLFAMWTFRWNRSWTAILLIVVGCGVYSVTNLIYSRSLLMGTYVQSDLINASWCAVFGFVAWAAHERWWLEMHPGVEPPQHMLARERWLEAVIPALLIAIMVAVALVTAAEVSSRILGIAAALFIVFAFVLAMREAWIQADSQRLNNEIIRANQRLALANEELQASENRYRDLNRELEARVAQRTTELGRAYGELEGFAYAVAHDLKSPLRSINSFAHLLRQHLGDATNPEIDGYLDRIRNGSLKMDTLIDDLLEYSQIERRKLNVGQIGLRATIASILAQCADDIQRHSIEVQVDVEPLTLAVDAEGLTLAIRNLIENAIKYSRDVGAPKLMIRARRRDDMAVLEIRDNGVGFDMAYHDQIFRIFQRLHRDDQYPGTGIGLALVRKAVERMRGRVWAQSSPNEGAAFFVEVPLDPASSQDRLHGDEVTK